MFLLGLLKIAFIDCTVLRCFFFNDEELSLQANPPEKMVLMTPLCGGSRPPVRGSFRSSVSSWLFSSPLIPALVPSSLGISMPSVVGLVLVNVSVEMTSSNQLFYLVFQGHTIFWATPGGWR